MPRGLTVAGEKVFFSANDGIHGEELWVTNADITQSAVMVKDLIPASGEKALGYDGK